MVSAERSGKATAEWISASAGYDAGKPIHTAVRLVMDRGWHSYWTNPGEAGMKTSIELELPAGWTASESAAPFPKRFSSAGLLGFGYEGEVLFPITLTPPHAADGMVNLAADVSWLTCDEHGCVPGDAKLTLQLAPGKTTATPEAAVIEAAERLVPVSDPGVALRVTEDGEFVDLALTATEGNALDVAGCEVFPMTTEVVDLKTEIRFEKHDAIWKARVPKSEYANGPVSELTLVIAGKGTRRPLVVTWSLVEKP